MTQKPMLSKKLSSKTFRDFYYLKEELVDFCRQNGLPTSGGKIELTDRIAYFLDTGQIKSNSNRKKRVTKISNIEITEMMKIEPDFVCSEHHRAFFKKQIGSSFSFNVDFQKWLKNHTGKTYQEAIEAYFQIIEDKKKGKTKIDQQFEYNTYIRDFFSDQQGKTLKDAIQCWNNKKKLQGHNRYEPSDLTALD